jgi:hypothetical protein
MMSLSLFPAQTVADAGSSGIRKSVGWSVFIIRFGKKKQENECSKRGPELT